MNTEEELLADALIEIINWIKSAEENSAPTIVSELISYGRAYFTFIYLALVGFFAAFVFVGIKAFNFGLQLDWRQYAKWVPELTISFLVTVVSLSFLIGLTDNLAQVWFAPKLYVIDKLTEIVIYD